MGWRIDYLKKIKSGWRNPFIFSADLTKTAWKSGYRLSAAALPFWFIGKCIKEIAIDLAGRAKPNLEDRVIDDLRAHPNSWTGDIADRLSCSLIKVGSVIASLERRGIIDCHYGERGPHGRPFRTYSLRE